MSVNINYNLGLFYRPFNTKTTGIERDYLYDIYFEKERKFYCNVNLLIRHCESFDIIYPNKFRFILSQDWSVDSFNIKIVAVLIAENLALAYQFTLHEMVEYNINDILGQVDMMVKRLVEYPKFEFNYNNKENI